jgi:predicted ATPase
VRLRYLALPRCGPLTDIAVVFGRDDLITRALNLPRKGSLNFVVGVNGSGKSSLLRALYRIFGSLKGREWPALPVTLAWDRTVGAEVVTTLLHSALQKDTRHFFATFQQVPSTARKGDWEDITVALSRSEQHPLVLAPEIAAGPDAITSSLLSAHLPKRLIAYTSGADDPWIQLDHPILHPKDEDAGQNQGDDDRPQGWSMDLEWEEALLRLGVTRAGGTVLGGAGPSQAGEPSSEALGQLQEDLKPLEILRQKRLSNRMSSSDRSEDFYFRICPRHLRYAGIAMALCQTAMEMRDRPGEDEREVFRNLLFQQRASDEKAKDARRVLNEIDWFWPTHLSLTYRDDDERISPRQQQELLCLVALADEVIAQPRGRQRLVMSLGPSDSLSLTEKLKDAFPLGVSGNWGELIAERVDGCKTGAEAFLRVLSADDKLDSTPLDVFSRLRDWERTGLLEDLTLTVKRIIQTQSSDGELDHTLITYDQLSDGEQMLLGRMGLLFLLRGQDGSLLLLDEPETHFNDVWKREIVEMADLGLLDSTEANVIIATHTSIALTDAFAAEVTVLDKTDNGVSARGVSGGLFGTDPGEVSMNLFHADSSTGSRSVEMLDKLLKTEWKGREDELEKILDVLGSSFHRAELRAVLKELRGHRDGTTSN